MLCMSFLFALWPVSSRQSMKMRQLSEPVNHAEAYGRIAFSCARDEVNSNKTCLYVCVCVCVCSMTLEIHSLLSVSIFYYENN